MTEKTTLGGPFGRRLYFAVGEIDGICLDALESVGCLPSTPKAIEIELFVEKFLGCQIAYEDLKPDVLGLAVFDSGGSVELVGAARSLFSDGRVGERRVRSTLAHEAGHGLLHAQLFSEGFGAHPLLDGSFDYKRRMIMCRKEDFANHSRGYDGKWWEWQANQAIGGLLLPRGLVEACVEPLMVASGLLGLPRLPDSKRDQAARRLVTAFDVNSVVAKIRLKSIFPPGEQRSL
ncbi:MAG: hypothetical protein OXN97_09915 [Bryobacterales bacterium]|nr:hypothetical protein [Bryobacterales bacterium]